LKAFFPYVAEKPFLTSKKVFTKPFTLLGCGLNDNVDSGDCKKIQYNKVTTLHVNQLCKSQLDSKQKLFLPQSF